MMYDETTLTLSETNKGSESDKLNGKTVVVDEFTPILAQNGKQIQLQVQRISKTTLHKGIEIRRASARWLPYLTENTLSNINLYVEPGKLTAIIGTVGAGKVN